MAPVPMRNKMTGEIRAVEPGTEEMDGLVAEVQGDGSPKWEQTSRAHARAINERADAGRLREEDLGHEDQPSHADVYAPEDRVVGPSLNPHLELSEGEKAVYADQGIEDYEEAMQRKQDELSGDYAKEPGGIVSGRPVVREDKDSGNGGSGRGRRRGRNGGASGDSGTQGAGGTESSSEAQATA